MSRVIDKLATGTDPSDRVPMPRPGERCPRCHADAGSRPCLLCAPHLVPAGLRGPDLAIRLARREMKIGDQCLLFGVVFARRFALDRLRDHKTIGAVGDQLYTVHEISAAGTYLPHVPGFVSYVS